MPDVTIASLESSVRGAGIALYLLWAVHLAKAGSVRAGPAFAIGVAAYLICSWFVVMSALGQPVAGLLLFLCVGNPAMLWVFARALFEDRYGPDPGPWFIWFAYAAAGTGLVASGAAQTFWLLSLGTVLFALAAGWTVWRGRRDDLVEKRRRLRPVLVGFAAVYALGLGVAELAAPRAGVDTLSAANATMLTLVGFASLVAGLSGPDPALFAVKKPQRQPAEAEPASPAALARLRQLFEVEKLHRDPTLTLSVLARRLELPEHRVRALINGALGHRNFTAFVNGHRLAEVRAALEDPRQRDVPVSTLAMDAGFGSLGAFNRAFLAEFGVTPTAFRARALPVSETG